MGELTQSEQIKIIQAELQKSNTFQSLNAENLSRRGFHSRH